MLFIWRKHLLGALVVSWAIHVAHITLAIIPEPVRVTVRQGVLKGKIMTSAKGRTFYAFQGIPYAKPPTGDLRFRAPQLPAPWVAELDATKPRPACMQFAINSTVVGSEDCLYLNVFTTYLPKQNGRLNHKNNRLLHVMFYIHGGGFSTGTPNDFPPQFLMDKDVVYVSTSYRLGVLGFLSTGDDESPGNYGLKDQTAALEWVQKNIAAFGGNPNSVTIFGQSAGGISVHYHILSKPSKGLFHRAISMSGTAISAVARCQDPLRVAQNLARIVNCTDSNTSALVDCLRHTDAVNLIRTYSPENVIFGDGDGFYNPCPENQTSRNPKPFLPAEPMALIRAGDFSKVPWLVGTTSQEMAYIVSMLVNNETRNQQVNQNFEFFCKKLLLLSKSLTDEETDDVYHKFVAFYLNGSAVFSQQNAYQLIEGFSDRIFVYPLKEAVDQQFSKGQNQIFWYNFAYRGLYSFTSEVSLRNYGVAHADDVPYLFPMHKEWPYVPNDQEVVELMLNLWTNFAKFGNPTPPRKPYDRRSRLNVEWLPVQDVGSDSLHMRYYNIGQVVLGTPNDFLNQNLGPVKLDLAVDLHKKGMAFWESLNLNEN